MVHSSQTHVSTSQTQTVPNARLVLRGDSSGEQSNNEQTVRPSRPRVQWTEDVVDNEHLNRKKTKICCIFTKQREFGESSSESSDSSDSDSSGSESSSGDESSSGRPRVNAYERKPRNRHSHSHASSSTPHSHSHTHQHRH